MKRKSNNKDVKNRDLAGTEKENKDAEKLENENREILQETENHLQENKNSKKPRRFKTWIETNRIYFEVFSYVFVGVMGIVISLVGLKFNKITVDIYKRQLQIEENNREPSFSLKLSWINEKNAEYVYEIRNDGGIVSGCTVLPISVGTFLITDKIVYVIVFEEPLKLENGNKCVIDFKRSKNILKNIQKEINGRYFDAWEYVSLDYINYKNKNISSYYRLTSDGMFMADTENIINSDSIYIGYNENVDIKQVTNKIREKSEDKN